jgi:type VI secretion system secreted protein VgrG
MGLLEDGLALVTDEWRPGQQQYFLDVPGVDQASEFSVGNWDAIERMGAPVQIELELTHPLRLSRKQFLNRDVTFIMATRGGAPRHFSGFIASFTTVKTTADFTLYRVVMKSHLGRLQGIRQSRIYQHQTVPEILETLLRSHDIPAHLITLKLRRQHPQYAFRFQYQQDDFDYFHMLMEKEGLYCYTQETEYGDMLVVGDDIDHYIYDDAFVLPMRPVSGTNAPVESITELSIHATTVPKSFSVAEYNENAAYERFKDEANIAPQDDTTYGTPYIYGTGHLDQAGAQWQARLRHEAAIAWQVVFDGSSTKHTLQVGRVFATAEELDDAPDGLVVIEVRHSGGRDKNYVNTFRAIPADRRFRLRLESDRWPRIAGTLSARVTSPDSYKYAYLTAAGYYTVRFDLDFASWPKGGESVPLRLAKPFAGRLQTGMHFPALDNDEATVAFRDGDPDKPYISGFHHHSQAVDLVTSDRRWISRNTIRTQSNNKLRMEDWKDQEGIKLSTEHSGKSQLNLGYLVNAKLEYRGEGYELRTSGYGAMRGGKGVYVTAYDQPRASGKQLEMQQTIAQLEQALEIAKALADSANAAKAVPADTNAQRQVSDELDGLKQPGLLASAPGPIGVVSASGIHVAASEGISAVAGKSADFSVMRRFTVAAGELVSIFAQRLGMKLFAAKGPVEIQAQSDALALASDKDMTITSVDGKVTVAASKELTLESGGGFIQLKDGNITLGGPDDLFFKTFTVQKKGPESRHAFLPALPGSPNRFDDRFRLLDKDTGAPLRNLEYAIVRIDGRVEHGVTDEEGKTHILSQTAHSEGITIYA